MVMNMKYKIVCVKERFVEFVNMYPDFLKQVYQEQDNMYKTKQIELIFFLIWLTKRKTFT